MKRITPGQFPLTAELQEYVWQESGRERTVCEILAEYGYDLEELKA